MKILVVGGAGMIGGHAALYLRARGHRVTIAGRRPPAAGTPLGELEFLQCDYVANNLDPTVLGGFDALVFAAGNDLRHVPKGTDANEHLQRANVEAVPAFFRAARDAGVRHAVQVGSFYPQARPELVEVHEYVRSRKLADDGARALATSSFRVMSVNPPYVIGAVPGLVTHLRAYVQWGQGKLTSIPDFTPPGGVNFISTQSLSEAIEGALLRGENGRAYLVGDENWTFQEYFAAFFRAFNRPVPPVRNQEHPMLPDATLYFGRGNTLHYSPDPDEAALLGYRRRDVGRAIDEIVAQFRDVDQ
jgi:nucleoside-diphosphate-sugar epimerase